MSYLYRYARWDGTQQVFEFDQEDVMDELSEDLIAHGDVWTALRKLFDKGIQGRGDDSPEGLRHLKERLRALRQEWLQQYNLDSMFDDIKERLNDIVQTEREGIDRRLTEARAQAAQMSESDPEQMQKLLDMLEQRANRNRDRLGNLPESPGGMIKELRDYEFMDQHAQSQFQDLLETLKQQMLQNYFRNMGQQITDIDPQDMSELQQMSRDLNQMLQDQMTGREPKYQKFMDRYSSLFGDNPPQNHKELMDQLARQMAQMQSLLDSMSPEMRGEMEETMDSLLDQETIDEMAELAMAMQQLYPMDDLRNQYPLLGEESLTIEQAMELMGQFQDLDELERQIQDVMQRGNIDDIDLDKVEALLGKEARRAVEKLKGVTEMLQEAGYIKRNGSKLELTPQGIRKIGQKVLREMFAHLKQDRLGQHELRSRGNLGDDTGETKPYEFGDLFDVDLRRSVMNAVTRQGPHVPVHMVVDDFEIRRLEEISQASTCLLLDQSRSMGMFGSFAAAKKVALALYTLIQSQFPRDKFHVIGFSDYAAELRGEHLLGTSWNAWVSGTNLHHAFMLSRELLSKQKIGTRQIIVITDGEPTVHMEGNRAYFAYPPSSRTIQETLNEVKRCTQEGITINTFMLESSQYLLDFVDKMTRINKGRAFYTTPDRLGEFVMVDYLSNKRKRVD